MIKVCKMVLRPLNSVKVLFRFLGFDGMNLCLDFKLIMSYVVPFYVYTSSDPKKGALGFFTLKNQIPGKSIAPYMVIRKIKLKNFFDLKGS
jgi:hypothetical protein